MIADENTVMIRLTAAIITQTLISNPTLENDCQTMRITHLYQANSSGTLAAAGVIPWPRQ